MYDLFGEYYLPNIKTFANKRTNKKPFAYAI
jgi:hypothetical protein